MDVVERTMATMGGMIDVIIAVSAVQRSPSARPRVSRQHLRRCCRLAAIHSAAPPRLGRRPLATSKNLSTPHVTIC